MLKLPNFIIIGAMKSATSTLQEQLVQQPGLYMSEPKEPNFFSDDDQYNKGIGWYAGLFQCFPSEGLLGEASTHYTKLPTYPKTIDRICEHLSNIRYVYVMRHPIDRLVSHYIHEWSTGNYNCDINEAINKYPELIEYSRYAMQLEPYFERFSKDNVFPVFFDRLITESQDELERVCKFIGYKRKPNWSFDLEAQNVSSERLRRFPFYNFLVDSRAAEIIRRKLVPKFIRDAIKSRFRMKNRPVINEETLLRLENIFNKDLEKLSKWVDKDINCNNFKIVTSSESINWSTNY